VSADDLVKVIAALAAGMVAVLGGVGALWQKIHGLEEKVNGRLTELLELTRKASRAEGRLDANPPTIEARQRPDRPAGGTGSWN